MMFNASHRFTIFLDPLSQEEIYNTPEFFAMSLDDIGASGRCPDHLWQRLRSLPWDGKRPNVIQARPHDFRQGRPFILGDHAHVDSNVRLNDGVMRTARDMFDWRLMLASFGDCIQTEFLQTQIMGDLTPTSDHAAFFNALPPSDKLLWHQPASCQLVEYTSRDIHRAGHKMGAGKFRLMVVAFESSDIVAGGIVLPSIRERDEAAGKKLRKIQDVIT